MSTATTSGGFLITFILFIFFGIVLATVGFRFKYPNLWSNSILTRLYRPEHHNGRLTLLVVAGAVIALTTCLPRWTRSSASWSDTFSGQNMFATCTCGDPSVVCGETDQTAFRAVQGFSVLGLLCLFSLALVAGLGAKLEIAEADKEKMQSGYRDGGTSMGQHESADGGRSTNHVQFGATSMNSAMVPVGGSNNVDGGDAVNSPAEAAAAGHEPHAPSAQNDGNAAQSANAPAPVVAIAANAGEDAMEPLTDSKSLVGVAEKVCLLLLPIAWCCSLCSWAIFINLVNSCTATAFNIGGTQLHWGWVFRLFEWLFVTAVTVVFVVRYFEFSTTFDFSLDRLHFFSLLLFGMSCLTTTTNMWSDRETGAGDIHAKIGPFFACTCSANSCADEAAAESAKTAFFVFFLVVAIPRNLFYVAKTNVWQKALGSTLRDAVIKPVGDKIDAILSRKIQGIVSIVISACATVSLLIALLVMSGVVAGVSCGASFDRFSSDIGLVSEIFVLCLCTIETAVTVLDVLFDPNNNHDNEQTNELAAPVNEENNNNNNNSAGDANFTDLRTEEEKKSTQQQQGPPPGHKKNFSNVSNTSSVKSSSSPQHNVAPVLAPPLTDSHTNGGGGGGATASATTAVAPNPVVNLTSVKRKQQKLQHPENQVEDIPSHSTGSDNDDAGSEHESQPPASPAADPQAK